MDDEMDALNDPENTKDKKKFSVENLENKLSESIV